MMIDAVLFVFLAFCSYTDIKYRKIFNSAVIAAVILGLGLNYFYLGLAGILHSLLGLACGFFALIVFYALGGVGAGDVKFLAAVGCLKGARFVLEGGALGAVIAGVAAILALAARGRLMGTLKRLKSFFVLLLALKAPEAAKESLSGGGFLPYAAFLSAGMALWWLETNYFLSGLIRWTVR
jgi:prepilin peptidase CpaA